MWTEAQVIDEIAQIFPSDRDIAPIGIGDDCALLCSGLHLITTDASIEGVHFDLSWMTLADAAYRCLASNLSDVAAMGAAPEAFTLALGLRPDLSFEQIQQLVQALRQCLIDHRCPRCSLVGGDVVRSPNIMLSITMLGRQPSWPVVTRSGARPGHAIAILGHPGYAAAGLEICRQNLHLTNHKTDAGLFAPFLQAFRRPLALTTLAPALAHHQCISAMMDTSDGLMTDLPRLLKQSHCGAQIQLSQLTPPPQMQRLSERLKVDPVSWMICGGEDFGLIVTIRENRDMDVIRLAQLHRVECQIIGKCLPPPELISWFNGPNHATPKDVSFTHFSP